MEILYGHDFYIKEPTIITIGKFDGLHNGHKKIINAVLYKANELKLKSIVYTFSTNPKNVLYDEKITPLISNEEKSKLIKEMGIDYLIYEEFDLVFSSMTPEEFVKNILVDKLNVKEIIMGENSTFGKDKSGDVNVMKKLALKYGFNLTIIGLLKENGEVISSTLIRSKGGNSWKSI